MFFRSLPLVSNFYRRREVRREQRLSAFFDDELSGGKKRRVASSLKKASLRESESFEEAQLREFSQVREQLGDWASSKRQSEEGGEKKVDLWDGVFAQIDTEAVEASSRSESAHRKAENSTDWKAQLSTWLGADLFRPPVFTAMATTAAVALLVGAWIGTAATGGGSVALAPERLAAVSLGAVSSASESASAKPGTSTLVASSSTPRVFESQSLLGQSRQSVLGQSVLGQSVLGQSVLGQAQREREGRVMSRAAGAASQDSIPFVSLVGSNASSRGAVLSERALRESRVPRDFGQRRDFGKGEFVVSAPLSQNDSGFRRPLRMHLETSQLIGADALGKNGATAKGGLRTGRTHIDWIKSRTPVRIVPSQGRNAPPVIWIPRPAAERARRAAAGVSDAGSLGLIPSGAAPSRVAPGQP